MNQRITAFGIQIDPLTMEEAVAACLDYAKKDDKRTPYVVTPNVDHIVILHENERFQQAYLGATMVLTDGNPVRLVLQMLDKSIPEVVPGSDLVPAIFDAAEQENPLTVFLLGAAAGVAERAKKNIHQRWSGVKVVGYYSPPLGFENSVDEENKIHALINNKPPDILIIGLGAPKQELWIHRNKDKIQVGIALCVGATIDFIADEVTRAPNWMRKIWLEWLYRILSDPRRLLRRYVRDAFIFPKLVWNELKRKRSF